MKAAENSQGWMDLQALCKYSSTSERTLRGWIHRPTNPLPASCVGKKLLVRKGAFDSWLENHSVARINVSGIVDEIASEVMGER
jgi:hypothetical protein